MLNTTIIDRRTTKQEVNNYSETNVEASGSISKENKNVRFNQSKVNYLHGTYTLFYILLHNKSLHDNVKVTFKNNKLNGKYYEYQNSKLYIVNRYKNNLLHGVSKIYDNGKFVNNTNKCYLKSYITYKNGKKNGISKTYMMNGKIISKSYYKDDLLHGLHQTFDYNTKTNSTTIIKEEYYEHNMLHGVCKYYNSSGLYILNYVSGKLDGKCEFIGKNGIIGIKYFKNHIPIGLHTIIDTSNNIKLIEYKPIKIK
jgi:antitoxin component YwqK of YwqJK toxin-antitoxin module